MTNEDFAYLDEIVKSESIPFIENDDRVSFFVRNLSGYLHFSGTDCPVCLAEAILDGVKKGQIKHKGGETKQ